MNKIEKYLEKSDLDNFYFSRSRLCGIVRVERLYIPVRSQPIDYGARNALTILDVFILGMRIWHQEKEEQFNEGMGLFAYPNMPTRLTIEPNKTPLD